MPMVMVAVVVVVVVSVVTHVDEEGAERDESSLI